MRNIELFSTTREPKRFFSTRKRKCSNSRSTCSSQDSSKKSMEITVVALTNLLSYHRKWQSRSRFQVFEREVKSFLPKHRSRNCSWREKKYLPLCSGTSANVVQPRKRCVK